MIILMSLAAPPMLVRVRPAVMRAVLTTHALWWAFACMPCVRARDRVCATLARITCWPATLLELIARPLLAPRQLSDTWGSAPMAAILTIAITELVHIIFVVRRHELPLFVGSLQAPLQADVEVGLQYCTYMDMYP